MTLPIHRVDQPSPGENERVQWDRSQWYEGGWAGEYWRFDCKWHTCVEPYFHLNLDNWCRRLSQPVISRILLAVAQLQRRADTRRNNSILRSQWPHWVQDIPSLYYPPWNIRQIGVKRNLLSLLFRTRPSRFLILWTEEFPTATLREIHSIIEQKLDCGWFFIDNGNVKHILPWNKRRISHPERRTSVLRTIVFVTHVEIINHLWVMSEQSFRQSRVHRTGWKETNVKNMFSYTTPLIKIPTDKFGVFA